MTMAIHSRRGQVIAATGTVLVLAACAILAGNWLSLRPFTEDGYYDLTIARHIAIGHGITIDGHTWTNGFQPLWVFFLVPIYWATGGDRVASLPGVLALSTLTWVAAAAAVAWLARRLAPPLLATTATVYAFAVYLVAPSVMKQHLNGLETGLLLLVFGLIGCAMAGAGPWTWRRTVRLAVLAGLLVLTRIDAVMFVPLLAVAVFVLTRGEPVRVRVCHGAAVCAGAAAISSPWWVYNSVRFGRLLPISGSAVFDWHWRLDRTWLLLLDVAGHLIPSPVQSFWRVRYDQVALGLGAVALVYAATRLIRDRDVRRRLLSDGAWMFVTSIVVYGAALVLLYAFTPATWMYERYTSPVVVASVPLLAILLARLVPDWRLGAATAAAGAAALAVFVFLKVGSPASDYYRTQIDLVRRHVPPSERVGAFQSGTLGYYREGVVNLDGKVNPAALAAHADLETYTRSIGLNWVVDWQWLLDDGLGSMTEWHLVECAREPGCPLCNFCLYARGAGSAPARHTIAGRVQDARGQRPPGATLFVCTLTGDGGSGCGRPLAFGADGSFRTEPLADATYVLVIGPSPFARAPDPAVERGLQVVTLDGRDLTDVTIHTSRYSLRGKYVMRGDNKAAQWPPQIHLVAFLVIGDRGYGVGVGEDGSTGAPNGEFLLENVLGPRVLRAGYSLGADSWWPWQVLLDGVDITDTPTDFSQHLDGKLEFVFTQHPARITGTVIDAAGRPVTGAWLAFFSADRALWNDWASTTEKHGGRSMPNGRFSMAVRPGRYLVAAIPSTPYQVRPVWPSFEELAKTATSVTVKDRGRAEITVHLPDRRRPGDQESQENQENRSNLFRKPR